MNINKKSWHYRFLANWQYDMPKDLCSYVRALVGKLLFTATLVILAGAIVGLMAKDWQHALPALGICILLVALIVGAGFGGQYVADCISNKCTEPGIISTYYKSFKEKYCPMITYVDSDAPPVEQEQSNV